MNFRYWSIASLNGAAEESKEQSNDMQGKRTSDRDHSHSIGAAMTQPNQSEASGLT